MLVLRINFQKSEIFSSNFTFIGSKNVNKREIFDKKKIKKYHRYIVYNKSSYKCILYK